MDRTRRLEQHTWAGNSPHAWESRARDLLAAATVLRQHRESMDSNSAPAPTALIHPAELMLDGMAIECLLKAVWVKRGHKLAKDRKYLGVPGAGDHDLVQLAGALKLKLSALEKGTLRRLSHFIEYGAVGTSSNSAVANARCRASLYAYLLDQPTTPTRHADSTSVHTTTSSPITTSPRSSLQNSP